MMGYIQKDIFVYHLSIHLPVYIMEYYSAIKKKEISPFVTTRMDLEGIVLSKISQTKTDKYRMISLVCEI